MEEIKLGKAYQRDLVVDKRYPVIRTGEQEDKKYVRGDILDANAVQQLIDNILEEDPKAVVERGAGENSVQQKGTSLIVTTPAGAAFGKFNTATTEVGDPLFCVGVGADENNRKNALSVSETGVEIRNNSEGNDVVLRISGNEGSFKGDWDFSNANVTGLPTGSGAAYEVINCNITSIDSYGLATVDNPNWFTLASAAYDNNKLPIIKGSHKMGPGGSYRIYFTVPLIVTGDSPYRECCGSTGTALRIYNYDRVYGISFYALGNSSDVRAIAIEQLVTLQ